jgi:hypothetical protein
VTRERPPNDGLPLVMRLPLVLLLAIHSPAFAAIAYDVNDNATVIVDGDRIRADLRHDPEVPREHDAILWTGGAPATALNIQNSTWYELETVAPFAPKTHYLTPAAQGQVKRVNWSMNENGGKTSARLTYNVRDSRNRKINVSCVATFEIETTDALPRKAWLGRIFPTTGYPEVDAKLDAADAAITAFPTRITMTVVRQYNGGGAPYEETKTIVVSEPRQVTVSAAIFKPPLHYRHQRPVVSTPVRGSGVQ